MFKWLEGHEIYKGDNDLFVNGYNKETKKIILENEEGKITDEVNLLESEIIWNINYFDDWQEKLLTGLIKNNGNIKIHILSTESGDEYLIDLYRHKTLLPTNEYSEEIILTSYVAVCNGKVIGDILSRQHLRYSGCAIDEQKDFDEWISNQIRKSSEFNNTDAFNTFSAIVFSDCLIDSKDYDAIWDMYGYEHES